MKETKHRYDPGPSLKRDSLPGGRPFFLPFEPVRACVLPPSSSFLLREEEPGMRLDSPVLPDNPKNDPSSPSSLFKSFQPSFSILGEKNILEAAAREEAVLLGISVLEFLN